MFGKCTSWCLLKSALLIFLWLNWLWLCNDASLISKTSDTAKHRSLRYKGNKWFGIECFSTSMVPTTTTTTLFYSTWRAFGILWVVFQCKLSNFMLCYCEYWCDMTHTDYKVADMNSNGRTVFHVGDLLFEKRLKAMRQLAAETGEWGKVSVIISMYIPTLQVIQLTLVILLHIKCKVYISD